MTRRTTTLALLILLAAGPLAAGALDSVLGPDGTLYQVRPGADGLTLAIRPDAGEPAEVPVPTVSGLEPTAASVGRDPVSGALVVVWQESDGAGLSTVQLATFRDGAWWGPVTLAGDGPLPATSPSLVVYTRRVAETVPSEDGDDQAAVAIRRETWAIVAWWQGVADDPDASAAVVAVPLDADGVPRPEAWPRQELRSGLAYGLVCPALEQWEELAHPQVVLEDGTGEPAVLFPDFDQCLLNVVRLRLDDQEGSEGDDELPDATAQRRRTILVLVNGGQVPIPPRLPLSRARVTLSGSLSILAYWPDEDGTGFTYLVSRGSEWDEPHRLPFGDGVTPEKALILLQQMVR